MPTALPSEVDSKILMDRRTPAEPVVCLRIFNVGNMSPFRLHGRTNKTYRFQWDRALNCHVLRIPHSVWSENKDAMAKDIFTIPHNVRPIVPTVELAAAEPAPAPVSTPAPVEPEAPAEEPAEQEPAEASSEVEQEEPESTADESEPESGSSIPQRKRKKHK